MANFINADRLKEAENRAFESAQSKVKNNPAQIAFNEIIHERVNYLLDYSTNNKNCVEKCEDLYPKKIDDPSEVPIFDIITVIRHNLYKIETECERFLTDWANLAAIKAEKGEIVTVIAESPLIGGVYRYGAHGDYWEQIGKVCGYV